MFLQSFQRESDTTLKVLKAYPAERADYRPHEKSRSAKELAWTFVLEQGMPTGAVGGHVDFSQPMPKPPADYKDVLAAFERGVPRHGGQDLGGERRGPQPRRCSSPSGPRRWPTCGDSTSCGPR